MRILTAFVVVALAACTGDLVELTPGGKPMDMAAGGGGGGGGQGGGGEMGPNTAKFADIQMDLDAKGCTLGACHGMAGTGAVVVWKAMATGADLDTNYTNTMTEINS